MSARKPLTEEETTGSTDSSSSPTSIPSFNTQDEEDPPPPYTPLDLVSTRLTPEMVDRAGRARPRGRSTISVRGELARLSLRGNDEPRRGSLRLRRPPSTSLHLPSGTPYTLRDVLS